MATELQTCPHLLKGIFDSGKECFVPRFDASTSRMDMVRLQSFADYEALPTYKWNIRQPAIGQLRENAIETGASSSSCRRRRHLSFESQVVARTTFTLHVP